MQTWKHETHIQVLSEARILYIKSRFH